MCALLSQSCPTLRPTDCSLPGSSVHGILQARVLEWAVISSSRASSQPSDWTCVSYVSCIAGEFFTDWATWEAQTGKWETLNKYLWTESNWNRKTRDATLSRTEIRTFWEGYGITVGFPCGSVGKESACSAGDLRSIPGLGRSPGEGKGYPLQYFWPAEFQGLYSPCDHKESQLSDFHFHFHGLTVINSGKSYLSGKYFGFLSGGPLPSVCWDSELTAQISCSQTLCSTKTKITNSLCAPTFGVICYTAADNKCNGLTL